MADAFERMNVSWNRASTLQFDWSVGLVPEWHSASKLPRRIENVLDNFVV
jgi:hypothetical protein